MTGTELLMAIADRFNEYGEAVDILVIFNSAEGNVLYKSNCNSTRALGLAQYAAADIKHGLIMQRQEEPPA